MAESFKYNYQEKLKSHKLLRDLFDHGKSIYVYPLRVFYGVSEQRLDFPIKAGVGTTKKKFKLAVHRNRVKRMMREGYRLNHQQLLNFAREEGLSLGVFFLYVGKQLPDKDLIDTCFPKVLNLLVKTMKDKCAEHS